MNNATLYSLICVSGLVLADLDADATLTAKQQEALEAGEARLVVSRDSGRSWQTLSAVADWQG